jgi:hypothetical protein
MAKGKSSLARNYDKLLAALAVALLAGAVFLWVSAKGATGAGKRDCDSKLAARHPAHPALDREEASSRVKSYMIALSSLANPFKIATDDSSRSGFFVPEVRVWCVKCRKPIPAEAEACPLCGEKQPAKRTDVVDAGIDSDGDGLPDLWEREHGFNPLDPEDASLDFDGDTFSNAEEYAAKTDPKDGNSHPDFMEYLRTASIEAARLPLVFRATSNMGGGNFKCQFNYFDKELKTQKTLFVKVGDAIGPLDKLPGSKITDPPRFSDFKLVALEWREEKVFDKIANREKTINTPVAIVERISSGRKIEFLIDKESTDATYVITIVQTRNGTEYVADGGIDEAEVEIGKDKFVLSKVDRDTGSVKMVRQSDKKVFSFPRVAE